MLAFHLIVVNIIYKISFNVNDFIFCWNIGYSLVLNSPVLTFLFGCLVLSRPTSLARPSIFMYWNKEKSLVPKNCRPVNHEFLSKPCRTDAFVYTVKTVEGVITESASDCFNLAFMTTYTILCYSIADKAGPSLFMTLLMEVTARWWPRSRAKTILWRREINFSLIMSASLDYDARLPIYRIWQVGFPGP